MTINNHLEHFEAVVPRVRLLSVIVPKPANIQIANEIVEVEPAREELGVLDARIYADIQMSRSLRRVSIPCRYVVPRPEHYGMEPEREPEPIPVTSHEMTINYHLEHFEAVVPRCEDIRGHPDEQKSATSWCAMPLCCSTPGELGREPEPDQRANLIKFKHYLTCVCYEKVSGEVECLQLIVQCEDIGGHPDEQESPTNWYAMPLCGSTPGALRARAGTRTNPNYLP
ncbi:unnamed protein product [Mytilus edulis]|uniref:Uncharacterized protein n=1 Tax=Mytilus edulis TaxID=6550 RepID=A0A8S3U925_MYTED|nr:unnamed protein product [Mytilus edulis]